MRVEGERPFAAAQGDMVGGAWGTLYDGGIVLYLQVIYLRAVHLEPLDHQGFRQNASKAGIWERH
jgi:hypothetical protein